MGAEDTKLNLLLGPNTLYPVIAAQKCFFVFTGLTGPNFPDALFL